MKDRVSKVQQTKRSCSQRTTCGERATVRNDSQESNIERQSKYMATAKAIEDLEDHEKTSESKLPKQAAQGRGQTTKGAGKHPKGKGEQAGQSHTRQEARKRA